MPACSSDDGGDSNGATATSATPTTPTAIAAPNVLLIIADDFSVQSFSQYSDAPDLPPTPNLDALAQRSVVFDDAWAYPTCTPTRAAMLTGKYGFRTEVLYPITTVQEQGWLDVENEYLLPTAIKEHGAGDYATANIGKWHVSGGPDDPKIAGWDYYAGFMNGSVPSYTSWPKMVQGVEVDPAFATYTTTDFVDESLAFIHEAEESRQPWTVWLALNAPHEPFHVPPANLQSSTGLVDDPEAIKANPRPYFHAAIEAMDTEIGRLLDDVDLSTTWVIFIGDNGDPQKVPTAPNDEHSVKTSLYPGGTHVPFMIAGPGVTEPRRVGGMANTTDLYATILEMVGADLDALPDGAGRDSVSLLGVATGAEASSPRRYNLAEISAPTFPFDVAAMVADDPETWPPVLRQVPNFNPDNFLETARARPGQAIRDERHLLVSFGDGAEELFDLTADPWARNELTRGGALAPDAEAGLAALRATLTELNAS